MITVLALIATIALLVAASRASDRLQLELKEDPGAEHEGGPIMDKSDTSNKNKEQREPEAARKAAAMELGLAKTARARQFMQYARDQAAQAESDESRANCGYRNSRQAAADSAQFHANYALQAAEDAVYSASGGPIEAEDAASAARQAAYRAQAAADRARYAAATATAG